MCVPILSDRDPFTDTHYHLQGTPDHSWANMVEEFQEEEKLQQAKLGVLPAATSSL